MNGPLSIINYPTNEQIIGKFHVTPIDKLQVNHVETIPQTSSITDETGCTSRFQMIRVDRNFGRGRWKVNDYEPPENITSSVIPVNTIENESFNNLIISNVPTANIPNVSSVVNGDLATTSSTTLASAAVAAAATAFQHQQQLMALNNTPTLVPVTNVPSQAGLVHPYHSPALANRSYLLSNHHPQFGYYPFYPSPYSPYAASWAAAMAASNPYLSSTQMIPPSQQAPLNDFPRPTDPTSDMNGDNTVFLYGDPHYHSSLVLPTSSPYATIPSYHPMQHPPIHTLLPIPASHTIPNNTNDTQQTSILTTPKGSLQQTALITTPKPLVNGINNDPLKTPHVNGCLATLANTNNSNPSLSNILKYATTGSPLNLTQTAQTAAATAVAAMGLLNNENSQNNEIANEILKGILITPAKEKSLLDESTCYSLARQLSTAGIDNKISAAMDLVKMHLLSAVREEVTELRQQIQKLNEKINSIECENTLLRQHVPSEIYAQYISTLTNSSSSNDSTMITTTPSIPSSLKRHSISITDNIQIPLLTMKSTPT
ncbi:unnamed protein product [Adineta steineri]|uniref:Uncharacterized protein n=1 Tax=Adineta steineri TaxID=433720 RepID=A0A815UKF2_9BILA|nr:unnamed protein product [Adineta steineri]